MLLHLRRESLNTSVTYRVGRLPSGPATSRPTSASGRGEAPVIVKATPAALSDSRHCNQRRHARNSSDIACASSPDEVVRKAYHQQNSADRNDSFARTTTCVARSDSSAIRRPLPPAPDAHRRRIRRWPAHPRRSGSEFLRGPLDVFIRKRDPCRRDMPEQEAAARRLIRLRMPRPSMDANEALRHRGRAPSARRAVGDARRRRASLSSSGRVARQ